jgi:exodeoxyribonuclease V alpha subunit
MIDVFLMAALVQALPPTAGIILLGDRNQLASVEAGSLFADLCGPGRSGWSSELCSQMEKLTGDQVYTVNNSRPEIADSVIHLGRSYRFRDSSGIGSLAEAVNSGSMDRVDAVLARDFSDLEITHCQGRERQEWLQEQILAGFSPIHQAPDLEQALAAMEQFRFLCALRRGSAGVEGINALAVRELRRAGLIGRDTDFFRGKPIIIRSNQYDMQLFNGDTGILWPDTDNRVRAWFRRPDNSLYPVSPARLPEHDPAYAVTIHKAQGSEFDRVLLLLPEEESRVLSRELLYTGITRAKKKLILCSGQNILAFSVQQPIRRFSGLADRLWGGGERG